VGELPWLAPDAAPPEGWIDLDALARGAAGAQARLAPASASGSA
jgi:hypothetical protein